MELQETRCETALTRLQASKVVTGLSLFEEEESDEEEEGEEGEKQKKIKEQKTGARRVSRQLNPLRFLHEGGNYSQ